MKTTFSIIAISLFFITGYAQVRKHTTAKKTAPGTAPFVLHTNSDSTSYAIGMSLIKELKARGITSLNYTALNRAITDGLADKPYNLTLDQGKAVISNHLYTEFMANAVQANSFMADNKTKPGVITLPSGLQYTVLREGAGPMPKVTDTVTVNYVGRLTSGKDFDNSYARNQPLVLNGIVKVIPGWIQGLQLMNTGSKFRFFIPYNLGYGDRGAGGGTIAPYSVLVFDVELLRIGK